MIIGKLLLGTIKGVRKIFGSPLGKRTIVAGSIIGVGLAGNGVRQVATAKKINKKAYVIQEEALSKHDKKLNETYTFIAKLVVEEKNSIELINSFMKLVKKINKCPSMSEIDIKIDLPSFKPVEIKKMSSGLDIALAGVGGGFSGALPGLVFCGANIGTLGFAALGSGVVLSIKGSKLSKQAVNNLKQAKKLASDVDFVIEFYKELDGAAIHLKEVISRVNGVYDKKLHKLNTLIERNNNYKTYSKNEETLVKNVFKLTILLANICKTKLAKRVNEQEVVNREEIEIIVEQADKICKETRQGIFEKVFA